MTGKPPDLEVIKVEGVPFYDGLFSPLTITSFFELEF